jgi:RecQ-mediated genome instability protein 1
MSTMPALHPLQRQVKDALQTRHSMPVNDAWLNAFLTSRSANLPPVPVLVSSAHFRVLASDITTSISPTSPNDAFPAHVSNVNIKQQTLQGSVVVQVLDVLDIGSSKWSQIEAIERVERGEEIRGREVIRTIGEGDQQAPGDLTAQPPRPAPSGSTSAASMTASNNQKLTPGPHRLVVQDAKGTKTIAFELSQVPKLNISTSAGAVIPPVSRNQDLAQGISGPADDPGISIGCKLLLKPGTVIRRGMVMLTANHCTVLGGKVENWDKKWREQRKQQLTALLAEENVTTTG